LHAAALAGDPAALPLGRPAPHPVLDAVIQGILQTRCLYRAISTNAASDLDSYAVAGEERLGGQLSALALSHPRSVHFVTSIK
jgi:hypothetical protein